MSCCAVVVVVVGGGGVGVWRGGVWPQHRRSHHLLVRSVVSATASSALTTAISCTEEEREAESAEVPLIWYAASLRMHNRKAEQHNVKNQLILERVWEKREKSEENKKETINTTPQTGKKKKERKKHKCTCAAADSE